jgi:hypothetical protein
VRERLAGERTGLHFIPPGRAGDRRHRGGTVRTEAITSLHSLFGAASDDDLRDRMNRMLASASAFGANENTDTVPTSRYVPCNPFA